MTHLTDWESICNRCGQCCFEKWIEGDGRVHVTRSPCRYLDVVTRKCKVYHKRFKVDEGCIKLTPEVVKTLHWLPEDCGYVRYLKSGAAGVDPSEGGDEH